MRLLPWLAVFVVAGCKNTAEQSAAPAPVKIESLGVAIDVPGAAKVTTSELDGSVTLNGKAFGEIFLDVVKTPVNVDELKKSTPAKEVTNFQSQTLSDGVLVTYDYKMGDTVASSIELYRAVGGKQMSCRANSRDKPWLAAATAACRSLRAIK